MGNTSGRKGGGRNTPLMVALRRGDLAKAQKLMNEQRLRRELARENGTAPKGTREFARSATAAKVLRAAISGGMSEFCDRGLSCRLTANHLRMMNFGDGEKGMRALRVQENSKHYADILLNQKVRFDSVYRAIPEVEVGPGRNQVKVRFPGIKPWNWIMVPGGANQYRLVLVAGVMSDYCWNTESEMYEAVHPDLAGTSVVVRSGYMSVYEEIPALELEAKVPWQTDLPEGAVLLVGLGIEFFQTIHDEIYPLIGGRALQVVRAL